MSLVGGWIDSHGGRGQRHGDRSADRRVTGTFAVLVLVQAAHSAEEYFGRLWEALLAPEIVSRVFSSDPQRGFLIANVVILAFGAWCVAWPVRLRWAAARALLWGWVVVEVVNGIGHPLAALVFRRYIAGVFTAPVLLIVALRLGHLLRRRTA